MHPWIGAGPEDRQRILETLGLSSIEELLASIPAEVRVDRLDLEPAKDETQVLEQMSRLAAANLRLGSRPCFLGAGVYRHLQPAVVDSVLSRAEFFTSYTPYQPEISQGTLQVIFEFQTLICQLTQLEVANASLYDGATALVEAALFCHRVARGKRNRVLVAETVHPVYRSVLDTYAEALGIEVVTLPADASGRLDPRSIGPAAGDGCCCVAVQSPSFLGIVEDLPALAEATHACGGLAVHVVAEAVSLGLLQGGGAHGFDVVCGEAQSFGLAPGYGGPHLGFFACNETHVRQMPGRIVGQTVDQESRRAFCLTLATREQHIRRAKATSNICTNHGLMALAATVWLECLGGSGLQGLARACLARAEDLKRRISALGPAWRLAYPASPTFNEMLVIGPRPAEMLVRELAEAGVLAGVAARRWGGSWPDGLLIAVTELCSSDDVDALLLAMAGISAKAGSSAMAGAGRAS